MQRLAAQQESALPAPEVGVTAGDDVAGGGDDGGDEFGDFEDDGDDFDENDFEVDVDLEGDVLDDGLDLLQPDPISYAFQQPPPVVHQREAMPSAAEPRPEQEAAGGVAGDLHAAAAQAQADQFLQGLAGEPVGALGAAAPQPRLRPRRLQQRRQSAVQKRTHRRLRPWRRRRCHGRHRRDRRPEPDPRRSRHRKQAARKLLGTRRVVGSGSR